MGSLERRAREKEATRRRILDAARDLFLKEGFESVSMRKIADAIEYTPAAIYSHFPDKHSMVIALCEQDFGEFRASMRHVDDLADPVERLRGMGRAYIDFALRHPHHYRFMFMTSFPEEAGAAPSLEERGHGDPDQDGYACLRDVVTQCIREGRFREGYDDVHLVTQAIWGSVHGVVSLWITHANDAWVDFRRPRESAHILVNAFLDGLLVPGVADGERGAAGAATQDAGAGGSAGEKARASGSKARSRPVSGPAERAPAERAPVDRSGRPSRRTTR